MLFDRYGGCHSSSSQTAISAFEDAVLAVLAHRPMGEALQRSLQHDGTLLAAHALNGFGQVFLARSETASLAKAISARAELDLSSRSSATSTEIAFVEALALAAAGFLQAAADRLEAHLAVSPRELLLVKVSHALRFMSGQPPAMLSLTRDLLPSWSENDAGFGYLLGCHAFGLGECGLFHASEETGREAVRLETDDVWGIHAVSHVMEFTRRTGEGAAWLEASRPLWRSCNNFKFHLAWHLALIKLEERDLDSVLELYDHDIMPSATDDFRDMANACSILWRLELEGAAIGKRWDPLVEIAKKRSRDVTYIFATLHYLMALAASGDAQNAERCLTELRTLAATSSGDQAKVAAEIGLPLAEVMMTALSGKETSHDLVVLARRSLSLGGSHAQRDVFLRTLLVKAADQGDSAALVGLTRIRNNLRDADRFFEIVANRRHAVGGHPSSGTRRLLDSLSSIPREHQHARG